VPRAGTRLLPRFDVVQVGSVYCAYDYLTRRARWSTHPGSFTATQMLAEQLTAEAAKRQEETKVYRADDPSAQPPRGQRKYKAEVDEQRRTSTS